MEDPRLRSSTRLTDEEEDEIDQVFKAFDLSNIGRITTRELGVVMKSLGMSVSESELQDMINEMDMEGNGVVKKSEFRNVYARNQMKDDDDAEQELREAFHILDKDGHGFVNVEEMREVLTQVGDKLSEDEVNEMIRETDINGDGKVNFEELIMMITSKASSSRENLLA